MLQQTRVATVQERYVRFLERFPTLRDLATAEEDDVLALWSGLGYYRRARHLHRAAQFAVRELNGKLPHTAAQLRTLPGVGEYTAAAIASIAFGQRIAVVDGNVERVLLRILGLPEEKSRAARVRLTEVAQWLMPPARRSSASPKRMSPGDHNQAMMELGATICLPKAPLCLQCPLLELCKTRGEHRTPPREIRQSRFVVHLLALRKRRILTEILLERRLPTEAVMPGMMELPPLPLDSVATREPVLRLRHAITNTNYYVEIFAESASGIEPTSGEEPDPELASSGEEGEANREESAAPQRAPSCGVPLLQDFPELKQFEWKDTEDDGADEEAVFVATPADREASATRQHSLLRTVSVPGRNLEWVPTGSLAQYPLTGLTRKALQRLRVMSAPRLETAT